MSKELVVSSTSHETRVAILDDDKLVEIYIERAAEHALVGSVYKGRVSRVLPGMQSAFVKVGLDRDAFLYVSDIIDQTEDIESGALDDEDDLAVASAPSPAPARVGRDESPSAETASSDDEQESSGGRRRRGRRSRRGRGSGSRFPDSKYADVKSPGESDTEDSEGDRVETRRGRRGEERGEAQELAILPGESLAKYRGEGAEDEAGGAEAAPVELVATTEEAPSESSRGSRRRRRRRGRRGGRDRGDGAEENRAEAGEASSDENGAETLQAGPTADLEQDEAPAAEEIPAEESVETDVDDGAEQEFADDADEDTDDSENVEEDADESDDESGASDDESDDESEEDSDGESDERDWEEDEPDEKAEDDFGDSEETDVDDSTDEPEESLRAADAVAQEPDDESERRQPGKPEAEKPEAEAGIRGRGGSRYLKRGRRGRRRRGRGGDEQAESSRPSPEQERTSTPQPDAAAGPLITELLKPGQEVIVQIAKEPLGKKGARITSHIALPGRYLVYMPTVAHVGVSRKISSDAERARLRRVIRDNSEGLPGGFIVRTAGQGKSDEELIADINFLSDLWKGVQEKAEKRPAPALLHTDLGVVERILRDQLGQSYKTIWVDAEEEYERIVSFIERFQPDLLDRVKLYTRSTPIFDEFKITQEIEKALRPKVWLKSGGYIVINQTEALVAIDVNTGKYVGKSDRLEDTIVKTNLEAVQEIVRQMRLRDLGGIIVVDFIDMDDRSNRKKVTAALEKELRYDRSPSKALAFNDFGLVAITRKRVKQSLERALCAPCPHCQGSGYVKSPDSVIYEILNDARKLAPTRKSKRDVAIRCHPEVAKRLKSRDNAYLQELEEILGANVIVRGDNSLYADNFDIN